MTSHPSPRAFRLSHGLLLLTLMVIVSWLVFYLDTQEQTRPTVMLEYERLFKESFQTAVIEAQLQDKTQGQTTIEINQVKINLFDGYPTPRAMLTLLGLPDCSVEQHQQAICETQLNQHLVLSVSGKGLDTQVLLYPTEMKPDSWWLGCMLIYTRLIDDSGHKSHFGLQLYLDKC